MSGPEYGPKYGPGLNPATGGIYKPKTTFKDYAVRILVQKFGGSSVRNLACQKEVLAKVRAGLDQGYKMVVVLSARAGDTNNLIALAQEWSANPDPAEYDSLVSTGEQVSVSLFSMLLKDNGIRARSLLAAQVPVLTNEEFGRARIKSFDKKHLMDLLEEYDVLVMAGFQGVTDNGRITTLGRGGSDTSAVAVAAALGAEFCEIYTDVDGVYTTDPRVCSSARKLDRVSYEEMLEMASMGAKVLEIRSVEFAQKYNVPVHVRSTFTNTPGTMLIKEDRKMEDVLVSGIAFDRDQALVTLQRVPDRPGVSAALFGPLFAASVVVDMIVQNPSREGFTDISFTVPKKDLNKALAQAGQMQANAPELQVTHDPNVCKVSVIGVGMRNHSGVAARAFESLASENINIMMISTSEIKISVLVEEKYTELAVRALHDSFELGHTDTIGD